MSIASEHTEPEEHVGSVGVNNIGSAEPEQINLPCSEDEQQNVYRRIDQQRGCSEADQGQHVKRPNFFRTLKVSEWVSAFGIISTFLVGTASLIISYRTYLLATDTNEIKSAVSQLSDLAKETKRSADAATSQVDAFQQDLRPIIYIKQTSTPHTNSSNHLVIDRRLTNAGRGAALNVTRVTKSATYFVGRIPGEGADLPYPTDTELDNSKVDGFIAPNSDAAGDAVSVAGQTVSAEESFGIYFGNLIWVEWGVIRYEDVFGRRHHLRFCHTWDWKAPKVETCPRGTHDD